MKIVIVLFAVMAVASAYPGIPWAAPVAQPWPAPEPWPAPAPWQPSYVKVAQPAYVKVPQPSYVKVAVAQAHPEVHQVLQVPQQVSIPNPHPQPLTIKVHAQTVRIPYHPPPIHTPQVVGIEHYVEPIVKVVKAPSHHPWA